MDVQEIIVFVAFYSRIMSFENFRNFCCLVLWLFYNSNLKFISASFSVQIICFVSPERRTPHFHSAKMSRAIVRVTLAPLWTTGAFGLWRDIMQISWTQSFFSIAIFPAIFLLVGFPLPEELQTSLFVNSIDMMSEKHRNVLVRTRILYRWRVSKERHSRTYQRNKTCRRPKVRCDQGSRNTHLDKLLIWVLQQVQRMRTLSLFLYCQKAFAWC